MSIFDLSCYFIIKNPKMPNRKFLTLLYFNPVNNEEKKETERLFFSSLTMLQSVAWLSFSVFGGSLKIES